MSYIGNTSTTQSFTPAVDYFNGNGATTAFTLSRPVASVAQIQVVIENVPQNPATAYTVSGNTITFTSAPPNGTNNIYVEYTSTINQVIAPSQGTVQPSSLSTGGPSWDTSGNMNLTGSIRLNSGTADGPQLSLASFGYSDWNWDNYSGRLRAYYNTTEYFTIDSSGNVGIGTSSPVEKLTVAGGIATTATYSLPSGASALTLGYDSGSNVSNITSLTSGTAYRSLRLLASTTQFLQNGTEAMRIDTSGNLLVGATSYSYTGNGVYLGGINTEGTNVGRISVGGNNGSTSTGYSLYSTSASAFRFYVSYAGQIYATNTTISGVSDQRLKENVRDLDDGLEKVLALKPRKFDWKEGKGANTKNARGFIAQEFETVFPDLIDTWKDPTPEGEESYKSVRADLIPTLVKAIQEQQALITQLQADVAELKGAK